MSALLQLQLSPGGEDRVPAAHLLMVLSSPIGIDRPWKQIQIDATRLPALLRDHDVEEYGRALYGMLAKHDGVREILERISKDKVAGPIYLNLGSAEAEDLCWEALNNNSGFFALDLWPISRIASEVNRQRDLPGYPFDGTLRLAAILSAYDVSAAQEWNTLKDAVNQARASGLLVKLLVAVGEQALLDEIRRVAGPYDEVVGLDGTGFDLLLELQQFRPHLLHFFCHGRSDVGSHILEMATIGDRVRASGSGTVRINTNEFVRNPVAQSVWLVTLNCCKMARSTGRIRSMAHSLVVDGGVPAVVGMHEPIDAEDAHLFCRYFYSELFRVLGEKLVDFPVGTERSIDWSTSLSVPRRGLHAQLSREGVRPPWTIPVLYVPRDAFRVVSVARGSAGAAARTHDVVIAGLLEILKPFRDPDSQNLGNRLEKVLTTVP